MPAREGSSPTWLHDILDALTADGFTKVVDAFLVSECAKFLTPGAHGHTLEQTLVHQRYVRIYESRIEAHLKRHGITSDDFFTALVDAEQRITPACDIARELRCCSSIFSIEASDDAAEGPRIRCMIENSRLTDQMLG